MVRLVWKTSLHRARIRPFSDLWGSDPFVPRAAMAGAWHRPWRSGSFAGQIGQFHRPAGRACSGHVGV
jgi:hypothetical protein